MAQPSSTLSMPTSLRVLYTVTTLIAFAHYYPELRIATEVKTKLENQLEKSRAEIVQLKIEKEQSAKELLSMKVDIDKMLSSTKVDGDSQALNAERKKNFELSEKVSGLSKGIPFLGDTCTYTLAEIMTLEAKIAESIRVSTNFEATREEWKRRSAEMSARIVQLEGDKERLLAGSSSKTSESERRADSITQGNDK